MARNNNQEMLFDLPPDWKHLWKSMPDYSHENLSPHSSIKVNFTSLENRQAFAKMVGQPVTDLTKYIWWPKADIWRMMNKRYVTTKPVQPMYPIYIPSKGRWETRLTAKAFEKINVDYTIVVEPQEYDDYAKVIDPKKILRTPHSNEGHVKTRNFIWDHARDLGVEKYWTFDDNIKWFYRYHNNRVIPVASGAMFQAIESFADRYKNLVISGCQYTMFVTRKMGSWPPLVLNTRVYSNMLIQTTACNNSGKPYRNEGFFNDDTDLCLRVLKDGNCTALFNAFLIEKSVTMTMKGGMTEHYQGDGRFRMAKELAEKHPDVTTISRKWGRWQHHVDYSSFRYNELIMKDNIALPDEPNNFGMRMEMDDKDDEYFAQLRQREKEENISLIDDGSYIDRDLSDYCNLPIKTDEGRDDESDEGPDAEILPEIN